MIERSGLLRERVRAATEEVRATIAQSVALRDGHRGAANGFLAEWARVREIRRGVPAPELARLTRQPAW